MGGAGWEWELGVVVVVVCVQGGSETTGGVAKKIF